jgi:hypothetical protein
MVKRKGKGKKRNYAKHVKHVGVMGGLAGFGLNVMTTPGKGSVGGGTAITWLMDQSQTVPNRLKYATSAMFGNMKELNTYYPLIGGALLTAAPRIPIVKIVANPVNTLIRNMTGQKWGL